MKTRVIIQARMGSARLRGKSLMPVAGKPLIRWVVESAAQLHFADEVCVATTSLQEDDPVVAVAESLGVLTARGSATDVLKRFVEASSDMDETDTVIRLTGDNPLNDPIRSEKLFEQHVDNGNDYTHIDGLSHIVAEFISVRALRDAYNSSALSLFDREHVTPWFRKNRDRFQVQTLPAGFEGLRSDLDSYLTVDTGEDLHRMEELMQELNLEPGKIDFEKVYQWLDKNVHHRKNGKGAPVVWLKGTPVGEANPPYVVAEIGQNHNGDMRNAKRLIDMAVRCGASAVKFQKRDIASELSKEAFDKPYDNPNSFGKTYGEHRMFLEFDEHEHLELKEYADAVGITYFCTPCDVPSLELLERIGTPFYKVASRDLTNIPLLEALGKTGKPVILSTGMAGLAEIDTALEALQMDLSNIILLQCTSQYPCALENVNLKAIETLKERYGTVTGLSDHTSGVIVAAASTLMGASMIEKHVTLDRTMKGTDQPGSLEESGLFKLMDYIRAIELAKGDGIKEILEVTKASREKLERSLTSRMDIPMGTVISEEHLTLKSPGTGLKWSERSQVVGKQAAVEIKKDTTLLMEMVLEPENKSQLQNETP
ncbi:MAG: hypothetical protein EA360_09705 [Balneolaceae bacterium]|nr:MAG: hypothetical protein EA360_09705 [Balneolaceae bacterium]